jgi:flagellar motor switch protein FliG
MATPEVVEAPADRMSGPQKAAIMLMSLDEQASASLFKHFQESEIEKLAREIANLGAVPAEIGEAVLLEVQELISGGYMPAAGGVEGARRLLGRAVGNDQSRRILDRIKHSFPVVSGFAGLQKVNPQQLSKFILGEHPQTVALILAHLNPSSASLLLTQLPDDMRADVLMRMASMEDIPPDVINRVSGFIDQRLKSLGGVKQEARGGLRSVADLFNRLDRSVSRPTLEHIESTSPDMAVAIRNLMFVFDDLVHVEDNGIREIVNRAERKTLIVALKGASEDVRQRFFQNMSKRAAEMLREEMEVLGAVRLREVEKSQHEVVGIARKLEEEGAITLGGAAGEPYVV